MAFWSAVGPEPKRSYRWIVTFGGNTVQQISYALKKVDKPKAAIKEIQHAYLNHKFNYPGRLEWETINMTFASVAEPDATQIIDYITRVAGYGVPRDNGVSGPQQLATIGKNKFAGALGSSIDISQVDANGLAIETWRLHNPFFTSIQYGSLDYSSEEIVEIQTTVRYDWAQLSAGASSDADFVGSAPGFPTIS